MSEVKTSQFNPRLKAPGQTIQFTQEQVQEMMKCMTNPVHFISEYMYIRHVDKGLIKFRPFEFQKRMLSSYVDNRFTIGLVGRQSGKSTITIGFLLWYVLFNEQKVCALLANKQALALELLDRIKVAYEELPMWMQQGVTLWNRGEIVLENGSKIMAAATSGASVRGQSFSCVFLDEFAFLHQNMAEAFFRSTWPTISSGKTTKVIAVSTPNGMNHFYRLWTQAETSDNIRKKMAEGEELNRAEVEYLQESGLSEWTPCKVDWWEIPGRDDAWKEKEIANFGSLERFEQEYGCDFQGSSATLIDTKYISEMVARKPIRRDDKTKMYEEPQEGHVYVCTVDTSRGRGLDYSAFCVFDVTEYPWKQVYTFMSDQVPPEVYHSFIASAATYYNQASVLIEINDVGYLVATYIKNDIGYDALVKTVSEGGKQKVSGGFGKGSRPGIQQTEQTKRIGCQTLKALVESKKLIIQDHATIDELKYFSLQENGKYEADGGYHDDLVMTLVMLGWLASQNYFRALTEKDFRHDMAREWRDSVEDDFPMPIIIDDATEYWDNKDQQMTFTY